MASVARTPGKSESVYINLQFWQFLRHFWTFSDLVIFSTEIFLGVSSSLVTLPGYLASFALPQKASNTPHLFISRETQNCLEMNVKASIYPF